MSDNPSKLGPQIPLRMPVKSLKMSDIPSELLREILLRLPGKSLLRLKCVCKEWRRIIDDPSFIRSHMNNQLSSPTLLVNGQFHFRFPKSLNFTDQAQTMEATPIHSGMPRSDSIFSHLSPEESSIVSLPCNGLILIFDLDRTETPFWQIANLLTRKCHRLPLPDADKNDYFGGGYGFWYDFTSDDYKVLMIDTKSKTRIYSLKSDSWRKIGDFPFHRVIRDMPYCINTGAWVFPVGLIFPRAGVFLNGKLHWDYKDGIIVFDVGTEDYHVFPPPPIPKRHERFYKLHLDALSGYLFCFDERNLWPVCQYDGWVMNEYGVEKSWKKLFSNEITDPPRGMPNAWPVAYFEQEKQVLLRHKSGFLWADIESGSVRNVTLNGVNHIAHAHLCTESLFPLGVRAEANKTAGNG